MSPWSLKLFHNCVANSRNCSHFESLTSMCALNLPAWTLKLRPVLDPDKKQAWSRSVWSKPSSMTALGLMSAGLIPFVCMIIWIDTIYRFQKHRDKQRALVIKLDVLITVLYWRNSILYILFSIEHWVSLILYNNTYSSFQFSVSR